VRFASLLLFIYCLASSLPVSAEEAVPRPEALYTALERPILVNLQERGRYLRATVELMSRDPLAVAAIAHHEAAIRHQLIMLFSQQSIKEMARVENQTKVRDEALARVRSLMSAEGIDDAPEGLYFTSFITE